MTNIVDVDASYEIAPIQLTRLHHFAYTTYDVLATRHFYEDLIGMPLTQTWIENPTEGPLAGHHRIQCFFGIADGGAIAYSQRLGAERPESAPRAGFHLAFKCDEDAMRAIKERLIADGYAPEQLTIRENEYCVSLYVTDPDGLVLEFAADNDDIDAIVGWQATTAHQELERWFAGDTGSVEDAWRRASTI
jgi:glyoxylase I family protein